MDLGTLQEQVGMAGGILFLVLFLYTLVELALLHFKRKTLRGREARMSGLGVASAGVAAVILTPLVGVTTIGTAALVGQALSPIEGGVTPLWWIYGFVVYEFWYWVQHASAHKVRLLWCLHSPHHAPQSIHMLVGLNHHFLETLLYFPLFLGFVPALFGVHPLLCVAINVVDAIWGGYLHISSDLVPKGRYGFLERFLQTPSHHRVHHAQNPRYLDMNYNSMSLLWDRLLGTLQPLRDDEEVEYGITRDVDTGSFLDVHFGEFRLLWRDFRDAETLADGLRFLFMPPGWSPKGAGKTVAEVKRAFFEERKRAGYSEELA